MHRKAPEAREEPAELAARAPSHVTVPSQAPVSQVTVDTLASTETPLVQLSLPQEISQLWVARHSILPVQAPSSHRTRHTVPAQLALLAQLSAPQTTSHAPASLQSTVPPHPESPQITRQATPGGHSAPVEQAPDAEQSIWQ